MNASDRIAMRALITQALAHAEHFPLALGADHNEHAKACKTAYVAGFLAGAQHQARTMSAAMIGGSQPC